MKFLFVFLFVFLLVGQSWAQLSNRPSFTIKRSTDPIKLDGIIDEASWKNAELIDNLIQQFPYDTSRSKVRTEFKLTYDDHFLYVSAIAYDNTPGKYVVASLRRDFRGSGLDGLSVVLDPFQDVTNGFFFGLSPAGVQREGLISNGYIARNDLNLSWDNKWYGATKINENNWVAEFAIPFKTLRYKAGSKKWNVKLYRIDSKENERAVYPFTPRIFEPGNLNYSAEMIWDAPLEHPGANISIIPYVAGQTSRDFEKDQPQKSELQAGGDAKVAVTSSLNLDLTVNPDFSQVEVDQQVTNLDRFEIFYPERRQFFLENADLFSSFGHMNARPFFSRRIGVARDTSTGLNVQNRILFGARLSGNLNKQWRVGLLNMQTAEVKDSNIPSYNYTVGTTQRRLGTNSNIRAIFVNRQQFKIDSSDFELSGYNYNRIAGLDYNYNFLNNKWTGNLFYHKQFTETKPGKEFAHGYGLSYNTQQLNFNWYHQIIGSGYDPAVGFAPRNGYKRISPSAKYLFYPKSDIVNNHGPTTDLAFIWDDLYGFTDRDLKAGYSFVFQTNGTLDLIASNTYTYLFRNFNATNTPNTPDSLKLPAFTDYTYSYAQIAFTSDPRKVINYELGGTAGQYYSGTRYGVRGLVNYRFQPYGVFSVEMNYNKISLPLPYKSADIYLISPRLDLTLTRSVFLTTFFQYNSQYNNVNINTRFQWRFKPVSDLFIVYTDNYFYSTEQPNIPQNFTPKNRALVLKLTYWLNM